ncbi:Ser/Thr protein phosphatase [Tritrichomonas foetus]|uniref:Serine/threonine-protein phosphatase n=1 Tax=Tritrichomonas foetus TaxID=1144522 RepID=A0A1J4J3K1_9EUKA|nr:Ser/Thr protein phosphatase [Tritrichomonas foetus]|eukprot:OHS92735.1 Ser/Thr protein phosphatase [Tritrichomonas foetus]
MNKSYEHQIADFHNQIGATLQIPQIIIHGYRFSCDVEINSDKTLHFYFHPLIRSFEFDLTINVKNLNDNSIADSVEEHVNIEIDLSDATELQTSTPVDDSWLKDDLLTIEFLISPTETDYSPQLEYIFEVLLGQLKGDESLDETAIQWMLGVSERIFLNEPTVVRTKGPAVITGDLHGQMYDMFRIFKTAGNPDEKKYIFLGDYVDRGYDSLDTFLVLLAYKIKNPNNFIMIRGNHECEEVSSRYGFRDEILLKYSASLYNDFIPVFNSLPIGVLIEDSSNNQILCVHGGLSPNISTLKEIEDIKRPFAPVDGEPSFDLLWTDPSEEVEDFGPSPRGSSFIFGVKPTKKFLEENNLKLIVRAHQMMPEGYGYNLGEESGILTVFSASDYSNGKNKGGFMIIDENAQIHLNNYSPLDKNELEEFQSFNLAEWLEK